MKTISKLLFLLCITVMAACTEKKLDAADVPQAVKDTFAKEYPTASEVEWILEKSDQVIYEAEFKLDGKKVVAEFSETGQFIEEE
jgi:hypothetical protein